LDGNVSAGVGSRKGLEGWAAAGKVRADCSNQLQSKAHMNDMKFMKDMEKSFLNDFLFNQSS
jgi:hypothetical protein